MATPIALFPQAMPQASANLQPFPIVRPERTSGALVLNINAPLSNTAGDNAPSPAAPAPMPAAMPFMPVATPFSPVQMPSGSADVFQRRMPHTAAPYTPNPFAPPEQQLLDAYNSALTFRNDAEHARNSYLNLANQLNGQAYQHKFSQQPQAPAFYPASPPASAGFQTFPPVNGMMSSWQPQMQKMRQMQQQAALQQQQAAALQQQQAMQSAYRQAMMPAYQQPAAFGYQQPAAYGYQQPAAYGYQQPAAFGYQQPAMSAYPYEQPPYPYAQQYPSYSSGYDPSMMQPQPPMEPQQPMEPQGLSGVSISELNDILAQQQTAPADRLGAINEIAMRQQGDPQTYELLKREVLNKTPQPGITTDDANLIRQASLYALGVLNRNQNANTPVSMLPGMDAINSVLSNKSENPMIRAAAVTALGTIDYPGRPVSENPKQAKKDRGIIPAMLDKALKDKNPDVRKAATQAKSGMMQPAVPTPAAGDANGMMLQYA